MQTWFSGMTSPEILFRGAANCAAAAKKNQGSSDIPVTVSNANVNTDCLSSMKVCTWNLTPSHDWDPIFSDCGDFDAFKPKDSTRINPSPDGQSACPGVKYGGTTPYLRTFRQYLGWGVLKNAAELNGVKFCAGNAKS